MGSVIIVTMPSGPLAAEPKKLHPFFTTPNTLLNDPNPTNASFECLKNGTDDALSIEAGHTDDESSGRKRCRAVEDAEDSRDITKMSTRGRKKARQHGSDITAHFLKAGGEVETDGADALTEEVKIATVAESPSIKCPNKDSQSSQKDIPPKKILQLNRKTGTIGSPPKPKESRSSNTDSTVVGGVEEKDTPKRTGKKPKSKIVKISYGNDHASRRSIGTRIGKILDSTSSAMSNSKARSNASLQKSNEGNPPQDSVNKATLGETHPFFTIKTKKSDLAPITEASSSVSTATNARPKSGLPRLRMFTSTPCSPKKSRVAASNIPLPSFGIKSLGLKTRGAKLAAWPAKDMVHTRGDDKALCSPVYHTLGHLLPLRKSKGNTIHLSPEEMILHDLGKKLELSGTVDAVRNLDNENFIPPPAELRLPKKHFESGVKLERRVLRQVKNPQHPALMPLRSSLPISLSSFDNYQCESNSWAQKYAPKAAVEVLQHGKEAFLLRDWLQALKVQSVDTGESKSKPTKPPKKKRKKTKLDSFIVDSDEEADEMDEVSDPEEDWSPDRRGVKKTVVRVGDTLARDSKNPARLTNTVVISGPSGCGKNAAVYAVAKELEFEIFEINPGSRRSGKDIMEKIGDMTRNHLVHHHQTDTTAIDDEGIAEDIKSGKQATMGSFFKPKSTSKPAKPMKPASKTATATLAKAIPRKPPPKAQKQSLILLDEVDILYEEDKQFWSTVVGLIAQSKRPFVITCNDESLVPLQTLNLHGIFRFGPPPADLAVDRLLMIAACEGHVLQRSAVEALYDARHRDIRACLMDLNYWCQFAVGDRRGAVEWYYPRWPRGTDIDEDGDVVRVISENTYVEGMGWLARDVIIDGMTAEQAEEELLLEAQDFWHVDIGNWNQSSALNSWAKTIDPSSQRLSTLAQYDKFTDAMSIADLCSALACTTLIDELIDCTTPAITNKARDDYVLGLQLLDAPVMSTFDTLVAALPIGLKCLARKNLQRQLSGCSASSILDSLGEAEAVSRVRQAAVETDTVSPLARIDFAHAFDVLAVSDKACAPSPYLDPSVFDGTFRTIILDVAPFVRGIVTYENGLQKQRMKLSNLISQGGMKRMRKTRASHAALEGGSRTTTRAERWFKSELNGVLVMHTAGKGWSDALKELDTLADASSVRRDARRKRSLVVSGDDDVSGSSSEADVI